MRGSAFTLTLALWGCVPAASPSIGDAPDGAGASVVGEEVSASAEVTPQANTTTDSTEGEDIDGAQLAPDEVCLPDLEWRDSPCLARWSFDQRAFGGRPIPQQEQFARIHSMMDLYSKGPRPGDDVALLTRLIEDIERLAYERWGDCRRARLRGDRATFERSQKDSLALFRQANRFARRMLVLKEKRDGAPPSNLANDEYYIGMRWYYLSEYNHAESTFSSAMGRLPGSSLPFLGRTRIAHAVAVLAQGERQRAQTLLSAIPKPKSIPHQGHQGVESYAAALCFLGTLAEQRGDAEVAVEKFENLANLAAKTAHRPIVVSLGRLAESELERLQSEPKP